METSLKRLDVIELFELGNHLGEVANLVEQDAPLAGRVFISFMQTSNLLAKFVGNQEAFRLSKEDGQKLRDSIDQIIQAHFFDMQNGEMRYKSELDFNATIQSWHLVNVKTTLAGFRHVFSAECRSSETYFIDGKLGYDISTLLHAAEHRIHETIRHLVPVAALNELRHAGRCLALESHTASGFHVLRALEVVMGEYYRLASGKDREFKSWNDYINALGDLVKEQEETKANYPSRKVVAMLDRIRQLDRNPLMHPRDELDEMSADTLFNVGIATITEMAKDLKDMAGQAELELVVGNGDGQAGVAG